MVSYRKCGFEHRAKEQRAWFQSSEGLGKFHGYPDGINVPGGAYHFVARGFRARSTMCECVDFESPRANAHGVSGPTPPV